jgi:Eukaryotic aspartyl protease
VNYLHGSTVNGDYISESVSISGGQTLTDFRIGYTNTANNEYGVLGLGYSDPNGAKENYPNSILNKLYDSNSINAKAYSLFLNSKGIGAGSILFGGIDTEKFVGTLNSLPIVARSDGKFDQVQVSLSSVAFSDETGKVTSLPSTQGTVKLDTWNTFTYLPGAAVSSILQQLGNQVSDDQKNSGHIFVDCNLRCSRPNSFITFTFGDANGPKINVPLTELILNLGITGPFANTCSFGIRSSDSIGGQWVLGIPFLRFAYLVIDLLNNKVGIAPSNLGATSTNVVEIGRGSTGIPGLVGKPPGMVNIPQANYPATTSSSSTSSCAPAINPTPSPTVITSILTSIFLVQSCAAGDANCHLGQMTTSVTTFTTTGPAPQSQTPGAAPAAAVTVLTQAVPLITTVTSNGVVSTMPVLSTVTTNGGLSTVTASTTIVTTSTIAPSATAAISKSAAAGGIYALAPGWCELLLGPAALMILGWAFVL